MVNRIICIMTIGTVAVLSGSLLADTNLYSGTLSVGDGDAYGHTWTWNDAELDMSGGTMQSLDTLNSSTAHLAGGIVSEGVAAWNTSSFSMTGGTIGWNLDASDSSTVDLSGGVITDWLYATDSSTVNIYGYGFDYDPAGGRWNGGQLDGFWMDGTPFAIELLDNIAVDSTYYDHVNLVPEPCTITLLSLGAIALVRRRKWCA